MVDIENIVNEMRGKLQVILSALSLLLKLLSRDAQLLYQKIRHFHQYSLALIYYELVQSEFISCE